MSTNKNTILVKATKANTKPLSLEEVKNFLRVDTSIDDELITRLIDVAADICETRTEKALLLILYRYSIFGTVDEVIDLPRHPINSVISVKRVDEKGKKTTIDSTTYAVDKYGRKLTFEKIPKVSHRLDIEFYAGFRTSDSIPSILKQGMLMHIARMYDDRNGYSTIPKATLEIYKKFKQIKL